MIKTNIGGLPAGSYMVTHCDDKDKRIAELRLKSCTLDLTKGHLKQCEEALDERDKRIAELEKEQDELKGKIENADLSSWKVFLKSDSKILQAHNLEQKIEVLKYALENIVSPESIYNKYRNLVDQAKTLKDGDV